MHENQEKLAEMNKFYPLRTPHLYYNHDDLRRDAMQFYGFLNYVATKIHIPDGQNHNTEHCMTFKSCIMI
jgi:hypothetical protein